MNIKKIRDDFPILRKKLNGKPIIYLDSACMSLKPIQVIEKVNETYSEYTACAGRSGHKLGSRMTEEYENARKKIAESIGAKPSEVVFTRNTTEGLNMIANSLGLKKGDTVLTTDREHNSNLVPWQILAKKTGIKHRIIRSKEDYTFDVEALKAEIDNSVKLISIVHSSNLDGYTLPVNEITRLAHEKDVMVMLDGAQSMPHKQLNMKSLDADFFSFSGHKMLGPYGTGILYGKHHLLERMDPVFAGGETVERTTYETHIFLKPPHKFEAGLQNYSGMIGLAEACSYLDNIGKAEIERHETKLNKIMTDGLASMKGVKILGPQNHEMRGGIISFVLLGINHHEAAMMLDNSANIMIRSGQHCCHSWFAANKIEGSARASLYLYNTDEEAQVFVEELSKIMRLA